jgi:hypothetical protein
MPNDTAMRRKKPKPAFDIDNAVEALIGAGRLREGFDSDPFLTARCYLGRAIAIARKDLLKKKAASAHRAGLEKMEKKVRAVAESLQEVAERLQEVAEEAEILLASSVTMGAETLDPSVEFGRRDHAANIRRPLLTSSRRRSLVGEVEAFAAARVGEVEALEAALRTHRSRIPQRSDAAFRPAFIEELVYCWVRLTAKPPTRDDQRFAAFVGAAHTTLFTTSPTDLGLPFFVEPWDGEEEKARAKKWRADQNKPKKRIAKRDEWDWQIEKTLKRINKRSESDGAYRYEQGVPPTVGAQPPLERRRPTTTPAEFDEETKRLNKEMLVGEGSRAAAQILWCEWELAGRELRQHFISSEEFGFTPADAMARIRR